MTLLDRFEDGLDFEHLVLKPHLHVDEWVSQGVGQIVEVLSQAGILGTLEKKLLLGKLVFLRHVLLAAQIRVDLWTVSENRVQLVLVKELVE